MLYPAELRGRSLSVYLCRTADAITGEKHFNRVTAAVGACRMMQLEVPVRAHFYC